MASSWIIALYASLAGVSGTVGATTLTEKQLAAHGHDMNGNDYSTFTDDSVWRYYANFTAGSTPKGESAPKYPFTMIDISPSGASATHSHSLSGVKSGSASSLPPYYALAFIMRIA